MALVKRVSRQGNSASVILDQPVLKQVGWETGTEVEVRVADGAVILTRHYATDDEARAAGQQVIRERRKMLERLARR